LIEAIPSAATVDIARRDNSKPPVLLRIAAPNSLVHYVARQAP